MKISWTKQAIGDLNSIYRYYEEINPQIAGKLYDRMIEEAEILQTFPQIASVEPLLADKNPVPRSLVVLRIFKIIYYCTSDTVIITNVWDCRRNPEVLKRSKNYPQ